MSDSDARGWPEVERRQEPDRRGRRRRSLTERRSEASWQPVPIDDVSADESMLFALAKAARLNARAPYSGFAVGAALQAEGGVISTGCNIENATYGLTLCAERVALVKALSEGHSQFVRIVIVADTEAPVPPCGPCRQLLWEYCGDIPVVLGNLGGPAARYSLSELLPLPFDNRLLR